MEEFKGKGIKALLDKIDKEYWNIIMKQIDITFKLKKSYRDDIKRAIAILREGGYRLPQPVDWLTDLEKYRTVERDRFFPDLSCV